MTRLDEITVHRVVVNPFSFSGVPLLAEENSSGDIDFSPWEEFCLGGVVGGTDWLKRHLATEGRALISFGDGFAAEDG